MALLRGTINESRLESLIMRLLLFILHIARVQTVREDKAFRCFDYHRVWVYYKKLRCDVDRVVQPEPIYHGKKIAAHKLLQCCESAKISQARVMLKSHLFLNNITEHIG